MHQLLGLGRAAFTPARVVVQIVLFLLSLTTTSPFIECATADRTVTSNLTRLIMHLNYQLCFFLKLTNSSHVLDPSTPPILMYLVEAIQDHYDY